MGSYTVMATTQAFLAADSHAACTPSPCGSAVQVSAEHWRLTVSLALTTTKAPATGFWRDSYTLQYS